MQQTVSRSCQITFSEFVKMSDASQSIPRSADSETNSQTSPTDFQNCEATAHEVLNSRKERNQNHDVNKSPLKENSGAIGNELGRQYEVTTTFATPMKTQEVTLDNEPVFVQQTLAKSPHIVGTIGHVMNKGNASSVAPTLIVMAPSVVKGLNIHKVGTPSHGIRFALPGTSQQILSPRPDPSGQVFYGHSSTIASLVTPVCTPLPNVSPATPSTPTSAVIVAERDPFQNSDQISVTCRKNHAVLDRRKLGSGHRGKCILFEKTWMTPSQFEIESGLSTSKDWKRSIRYAGCTVQKLINDGFLKPHSAVCTCAVCSDDDSVTCPIRLFQPYKRRKRSSVAMSTSYSPINSPIPSKVITTGDYHRKSPPQHYVFSPLPPNTTSSGEHHQVESVKNSLSPQAESLVRLCIAESELSEQRMWWQLEEMSNNLMEQAQRLKTAISEAKSTSINQRTALLHKIASHFTEQSVGTAQHESNRQQTSTAYVTELNTTTPSAISSMFTPVSTSNQRMNSTQTAVSKPVTEQRLDRRKSANDGSSQQFCNTCGNAAISKCTGCHKATYCSTACQEKDWLGGHSEECRSCKTAESMNAKSKEAIVIPCATAEEDSYPIMSTASALTNRLDNQLKEVSSS